MNNEGRLVELREVCFNQPTSFIGWGGDTQREYVRAADAVITLDRALREVTVEPREKHGTTRGEGFTVPVTAVKQWKVKPNESVEASTATSSTAPAKAKAASAAKSSA